MSDEQERVQEMVLEREAEYIVLGLDEDEESLYVEADGIGAYYNQQAALKFHTQLVDHQLYEEWPDDLARQYIEYMSDLIDVIRGDKDAEVVADEWDLDSLEGNKEALADG